MVVGLLGNKSSDSNRLTLVTPKSENDVRLQATLGNQNPTGLPVGAVRTGMETPTCFISASVQKDVSICFDTCGSSGSADPV